MTFFSISNTSEIGKPVDVFDANGKALEYVLWCDTESGEYSRLCRDSTGNFVIDETGGSVKTEALTAPAPLTVEPKVEDKIVVTQEEIHQLAVEKGWWDEWPNKGEKIALMHSELSEALEAMRTGKDKLPDEHCPEFNNLEVELADLIIRVLDFAGAYHLRVSEALIAKHEYNKTRPYKHGKKF